MATADADPRLAGSLSCEDLERAFERFGVPGSGRRLVLTALVGDPVRRVGGGRRNVVVRYNSRKMGCLIQAESRSVELPFVYRCEFDPHVLLYLCQPARLHVRLRDSRGRSRLRPYVPDFLVYDDRTGFCFVECKPVSVLEADQAKPYPKFTRLEDGRWTFPAAEEALRGHGVSHRIFTSDEVNPIWDRNVRFLAGYVGADEPAGVVEVRGKLRRQGSIRTRDLLAAPGVPSAAVWWLAANREAWIEWERCFVADLDASWAHASESALLAHRHLPLPADPSPEPAVTVKLEPGARLLWDGVPWTVLNRGADKVTLQDEGAARRVVSLPLPSASVLLRDGAIACGAPTDHASEARERIMRSASPEALDEAVRRQQAIDHFTAHGEPPAGVSLASIRRWQRWARDGERRYGLGFAGLVRRRGRKPGTPDLDPRQQEVLAQVVDEYVHPRKRPKGGDDGAKRTRGGGAGGLAGAYAKLVERCRERDVSPPPSRETLRRAIKREPLAEVVRQRRGDGAAYSLEGPVPATGHGTPPHGDRAFEVGEVDHTPLDVRLVSSRTGAVLGSPWLTVLTDAYSRKPLAFELTFDPPSRATVLNVLSECVRRHNRVPDYLVMDRGSEFQSTDVETAFVALGIDKVERPARSPRYGAVIERLFGAVNTRFAHELAGSTKLLALGRALSPSHHPDRDAEFTLSDLHEFCERWFFEVYPSLVHRTLGQPPDDLFHHSLAVAGERLSRYVRFDQGLRILLAATPEPPYRVVDPGRGITVDYLRYWHDAFASGDLAGRQVDVKLDPADCSVAFARVHGQWISCDLAEGREYLLGRSWRQIRIGVREWRAQRREGIRSLRLNATRLGHFLAGIGEVSPSESALPAQIARDAELVSLPRSRASPDRPPALRVIPGGRASDPLGTRRPRPGLVPSSARKDEDHEEDFRFEDLEPFDGR